MVLGLRTIVLRAETVVFVGSLLCLLRLSLMLDYWSRMLDQHTLTMIMHWSLVKDSRVESRIASQARLNFYRVIVRLSAHMEYEYHV